MRIKLSRQMPLFLSVQLLFLFFLLVWSPSVFAVPSLQLDILGGSYDSGTQTIVSSSNQFTLYALLKPTLTNTLSDTYYISAAITPMVAANADLGSFQFNGETVDVTGDMVYGVPPLEQIATLQGWDANDLGQHGIYPTYFREFEFQFSTSNRANEYNTQDDAGQGPTADPAGPLYYAAFSVDTSGLSPGYAIHFDLYNTTVRNSGDVDRTGFAPFSHDAQSATVPEPSAILLLGSGLMGLGFWGRKFQGTRG